MPVAVAVYMLLNLGAAPQTHTVTFRNMKSTSREIPVQIGDVVLFKAKAPEETHTARVVPYSMDCVVVTDKGNGGFLGIGAKPRRTREDKITGELKQEGKIYESFKPRFQFKATGAPESKAQDLTLTADGLRFVVPQTGKLRAIELVSNRTGIFDLAPELPPTEEEMTRGKEEAIAKCEQLKSKDGHSYGGFAAKSPTKSPVPHLQIQVTIQRAN